MIALKVFAQGKLLLSESYWPTLNSGSSLPSTMFFWPRYRVAALPRFANHKSRIQIVARQVEASVVIRAAKLKFVAESRTRAYFKQHITSTSNTVFWSIVSK